MNIVINDFLSATVALEEGDVFPDEIKIICLEGADEKRVPYTLKPINLNQETGLGFYSYYTSGAAYEAETIDMVVAGSLKLKRNGYCYVVE